MREFPRYDCTIYKYKYFYICMYIYMFILLSSPYLVVVGDDCIRGTREQMLLLQMVLVKLSDGVVIAWEFYYFMVLK